MSLYDPLFSEKYEYPVWSLLWERNEIYEMSVDIENGIREGLGIDLVPYAPYLDVGNPYFLLVLLED